MSEQPPTPGLSAAEIATWLAEARYAQPPPGRFQRLADAYTAADQECRAWETLYETLTGTLAQVRAERDQAQAEATALRAVAQEVWEAALETAVADTYPGLADTLYELGYRLHGDAARLALGSGEGHHGQAAE